MYGKISPIYSFSILLMYPCVFEIRRLLSVYKMYSFSIFYLMEAQKIEVFLQSETVHHFRSFPFSRKLSKSDKPHQMLALLSKPDKPGDLRPISLSSTDSFLAAERACASSDFGDDPSCEPMRSAASTTTTTTSGPRSHPNEKVAQSEQSQLDDTDVTTCHHNPMYTDNE